MPTFFLYDVFVQHDVDLWDDDGKGIDGADRARTWRGTQATGYVTLTPQGQSTDR